MKRWSVAVARIAHIEIRLHVSMLLLVWLAAANASTDSGGFLGASSWMITIFACVLLHEFSHCVVARHLGIGVREIELLPIGGVSKMERIPNNPNQELAISLAGPAASLVIGAISLAVASLLQDGRLPPFDLTGGAFIPRIAWFNLIIGAFNLLPALPLDGGRALRALFERHEGPNAATHHAARIARKLALVIIIVGAVWNLVLMIIGLFVHVASRGEELNADVQLGLAGLRAEDVMVHNPMVVPYDGYVRDLDPLLSQTTQRQFPVVNEGTYVGLVDMRLLNSALPTAAIADVMRKVPAIARSSELADPALFGQADTQAVVDDADHVVGLLRREDVGVALARRIAVAR